MGLARMAELVGLSGVGSVALVVCIMPLINFSLHYFWTYR
jgi:hypothetical protein